MPGLTVTVFDFRVQLRSAGRQTSLLGPGPGLGHSGCQCQCPCQWHVQQLQPRRSHPRTVL
eukprot:3156371-Rhodomonas_salina.1